MCIHGSERLDLRLIDSSDASLAAKCTHKLLHHQMTLEVRSFACRQLLDPSLLDLELEDHKRAIQER